MQKTIDVIGIKNDECLSVLTDTNVIKFYDQDDQILQEKKFENASHVQLYDHGRNLLLLNKKKKNVLSVMDTEYGKVINHANCKFQRKNWDLNLNTIVPSKKFDPLDQKTLELSGIGGKQDIVFKMIYDQRSDDLVVKKNQGKNYKTTTFTSIATGRDGTLYVGDEIGTLRLYKDPSKSATTKYTQLEGVTSSDNKNGDPIIGVDVTNDGKWLSWTTKGFVTFVSLKEKKARAMLLKISNKDKERYNIKPDFLPAKFDVGPLVNPDSSLIKESFLYTFTGNYMVVWNMRTLVNEYRNGTVTCYGTLKETNSVVQDFVPEYGRPSENESVARLGSKLKHLTIN